MSNVNLVCRDGVVYSHKIVLASVSGFVETLLRDIPVGDDVGVFLSDFSKKEVNKLLRTKGVFGKEETEDCSEKGSGELTEYLVDKSVLDEEEISEDEFALETAELLKSSLEVKMEATDYFMTEQSEHIYQDPHEFDETIGVPKSGHRKTKLARKPVKKIQKRGGKKSESLKNAKYPTEMTRRERLRMSAKKWRDKNHELVKLKQLQDRLEIKKRRLKDPEYNAMMKARQAERKRRSRALKKAAEQLAHLEMESVGIETDPGGSKPLNHEKEDSQKKSNRARKYDNRKSIKMKNKSIFQFYSIIKLCKVNTFHPLI